jgi:hypothetical protein
VKKLSVPQSAVTDEEIKQIYFRLHSDESSVTGRAGAGAGAGWGASGVNAGKRETWERRDP